MTSNIRRVGRAAVVAALCALTLAALALSIIPAGAEVQTVLPGGALHALTLCGVAALCWMAARLRGAGRAAAAGALGAIAAGALALSLAPMASNVRAWLTDCAVWALALGGACALYGTLARLDGAWRVKRLWALAALFAGVVTMGQSFAAVGNMELIRPNAKTAVFFLGRAALYYAGMRLLLAALTRRSACGGAPRWLPFGFGGALLLCWLPWAVCLYPGTVSNDSNTQLMQIMGVMPLSNGNPIFQTFLVAAFRQLGLWLGGADAGVALYCGVQAMLMAWLLGTLVAEMYASAAPRWLCWGTLAFYGVCPVFPVFAFCVGKDTNFAMAVLFLNLTMWRMMRAERPPRAGETACLCVAAVLCTLLRNPGVWLAALSLGLLLGWMLRRKRDWRAPAWALGSVAAVYAALHLLVIPALDIAPTPETENYSLPLQQVARVAVGNGLTPQEAEAVNGVLRLDEVRDAYNGELSDPVKNLWREDAAPQAKAAFWRAWGSIALHNPATCLSATFHNTYGYLYPGYMSVIRPTLLIGDLSSDTANVKGLYDFSVNPRAEEAKEWTKEQASKPLYRVLIAPGLYGWATLFAAACLMRRRGNGALLCAVPALFTLAGCVLSAVNGYFRYAMPLYVCAPLLLWLVGEGVRCASVPDTMQAEKREGRNDSNSR